MSIRNEEIVYVRLVDEMVEVWRPVKAVNLSGNRYMLTGDQKLPDDEEWEFQPGEVVEVDVRVFDGQSRKIVTNKKIS